MFARIPEIDHFKFGRGFVGILNDNLPRSVHKEAAKKALAAAEDAIKSGKYALVVLDEVNVAVSLKLLSARDVLRVVIPPKSSRSAKLPIGDTLLAMPDIILTGRGAPASFLRAGDIVTECNEYKHIYNLGVRGKRGREY